VKMKTETKVLTCLLIATAFFSLGTIMTGQNNILNRTPWTTESYTFSARSGVTFVIEYPDTTETLGITSHSEYVHVQTVRYSTSTSYLLLNRTVLYEHRENKESGSDLEARLRTLGFFSILIFLVCMVLAFEPKRQRDLEAA
jgi:hypothetical protein